VRYSQVMLWFPAYAEPPDPANTSLTLILALAAIVAAAGAMAFVPILSSWRRRHCHTDGVLAIAILWGLLAAGSGIYAAVSQMNWSKEQTVRIETGYYDPRDASDAPALPWRTWVAIAIAYGGLVGWAEVGGRSP
jgi:hypothetical protein